ncbi:unnamed protein product [Schistocephalus solidus]|uniref:Uncharacterized protein n=1 Tax=Schistocephalus solidus TaxID=70667 RepID=A0A183THU9_SCHSO|nr:unnamed protein product [Schistocephalus solidus]
MLLWLLEVGFFPAVTTRATTMTGGLNQLRVSGAVCFSTLVTFAPIPLLFPLARPPCLLPPLPFPLYRLPPLILLPCPLSNLSPSHSPPLFYSHFSPSPLLHLTSLFPPPPRSKTSYGEGYPPTARVSLLNLVAWNFRSVLDTPRSNRTERRTAPVARKLACYKVDIAALSETRFSEQGQLEEVGAGYNFF